MEEKVKRSAFAKAFLVLLVAGILLCILNFILLVLYITQVIHPVRDRLYWYAANTLVPIAIGLTLFVMAVIAYRKDWVISSFRFWKSV